MQSLLYNIQYRDDQQAFAKLYGSLFFKLYQFVFSYTPSREVAEELVNDVFLRLWLKRSTLDSIINVKVYLYVSVKNAALNYLRDNKLQTPASIDELSVQHLQVSSNPESLMVSREMQMRIHQAIETLPPRCRIIFKLVKEDGLSYKEVANILDLSVKTVDAQLYISLKKLSHLLRPELPAKTNSGSIRLKQRQNNH